MAFTFNRIAVTIPPAHWFMGIATTMYEMYRQGLVDLGFELFDVPVEPFLSGDRIHLRSIVRQLEAFQPDIAIGLPKGAYALLCRMPPRRNASRLNLFTQVLGIPTICLWDHAPFELADQLLGPFPSSPQDSSGGALHRLREVLSQPRLVHWSPDRGQTAIMQELGLIRPEQVLHESLPALPGFEPEPQHLRSRDQSAVPRVAFVGHVYQHERESSEVLEELATRVVSAWCATSNQSPLWDVLTGQLAAMSSGDREHLALMPDQTFFWRFAHSLIIRRAQTALRLERLGAIPCPVACYGNLELTPGMPSHLLPVPGHVPFGPPLARTLARHEVTVDVMNPGSVQGYSHKPGMTFSSGGFALIDRKTQFLEAFGDAGEAVSYESNAELAAKVEHFLSHPSERREAGDTIRAILRERFQLRHVLERVLSSAAVESALRILSPPRYGLDETDVIPVTDLLAQLRAETYWNSTLARHAAGCELATSADAWTFAAHVPLPGTLAALHEPHVRLHLTVDAGSLGIAVATGDPWQLSGEQIVTPAAGRYTVVLELPDEGEVTLLLRNGSTAPTRVQLARIELCERPRR